MEDTEIKSEAAVDKKGNVSLKIRGPNNFVLEEIRRLDARHKGAPLRDVVPMEIRGTPNPPSKS